MRYEKLRRSSHTIYDIKYHIVWITKYRKPILRGPIGYRIKDLISQICRAYDVEIIKVHISKNHVHLFVSIPPDISVSKLVQWLKGKTSYKVLNENKILSKEFWGRHMWARGYFAASSGNIADEVIMKYIEDQGKEPTDEDFRTDDDLLRVSA